MSKHDDEFWGGQAEWVERDATSIPSRADHVSSERTDPAPHDEWADAAVWSDDARRPLDRLRRRWSSMLSAGTNPTREHGIVRPEVARTRNRDETAGHAIDSTMFDDLDDDFIDEESAAEHPVRSSGHVSARTASERIDGSQYGHVDGGRPDDEQWDGDQWDDGQWDAEFAAAPVTGARDVERGPGIDPLLARIGVIAVATALLIPLMLNNGSDDADTLLASTASAPSLSEGQEGQPVAPTLFPADAAPTPDGVPAVTPPNSTPLDISDLPRAVPVNPPAAPASNAEVDAPTEEADATATPSTESLTNDTTSAASSSGAGGIDDVARADAPATRVEPVCAIDYVVVDGDFWIRIADGAGVDLAELLDANRATVETPLFAGQSICLPAGSSTPPPPVATTTAPPTTPATTAPPSTTPVTTAPPTTVATPPPGSDEVIQIIRDVWPDDLEERALEIAFRESRYDPRARNSCCYGLFQIYWSVHRSWLTGMGITESSQLYDAETNARAAYALYERAGGWGPWGF